MQTCPFCGHDFKIELSRVQGPWAFYECGKCLELAIVRGPGEFDLPLPEQKMHVAPVQAIEHVEAKPLSLPVIVAPAAAAVAVAAPELALPPPPSPRMSVATSPAVGARTSSRFEAFWSATSIDWKSRLPRLPKLPQLPRYSPRLALPKPAALRSWAISGSSFAMTLICGALLIAALLLPFTVPLIRDAVNAYQDLSPREPAASSR